MLGRLIELALPKEIVPEQKPELAVLRVPHNGLSIEFFGLAKVAGLLYLPGRRDLLSSVVREPLDEWIDPGHYAGCRSPSCLRGPNDRAYDFCT
jgi:hypothetical protein